MIPGTLAEWTYETIELLLRQGQFEPETFDYKELLPSKDDKAGKLRLRKECCAFANSGGGFLIFGIKDERSLAPEQRITGYPSTFDFPIQFGVYPQYCKPSVQWYHAAVRIPTPSTHLLHIIHIPRSWRGPHVVEDDQKRDLWHFPKRTNKGIEPMSYEEARMSFTGQYERRRKLGLLRRELEQVARQSQNFFIPEEQANVFTPAATEIGTAIIESIISDSYLILEERPALLTDLDNVRNMARQINVATARYYQQMTRLPIGKYPRVYLDKHNATMVLWTDQIRRDIDRCIEALDQMLQH